MDLLPRLAGELIPGVISRRPTNLVYLTFDDGPDPDTTNRTLDILNQAGVSAAFFLTGFRVEQHPEVVRRIKEEGGLIGSHGYHHCSLLRADRSTIIPDLRRSIEVIQDASGLRPRLFRPPYGRFNPGLIRIAEALQLKIVLWSLIALDYQIKDASYLIRRIVTRAVGGDIILLHDQGRGAPIMLKALPAIIDGLHERGLEMGSLANL
ncbi:MAG: polysaccharide deacetylase family protein [Calditrichota bacterium]